MELKLIGKFCSSVLIMQTQEARVLLFISNEETRVCARAPYQWLVLRVLQLPCCLGGRDLTSCIDVSIHWPGLDLPPFLSLLSKSFLLLCPLSLVLFLVIIASFWHQICACLPVCSVLSNPLGPHALWPTRILCPWGSLGKNNWSGLRFPPPGDLPDPGIEPVSPCIGRQII